MAVSYPGISYLRGYEPKDPLEQFAKGFGFGEGIRNEAGAKDALSAYIDSLTGGQAQAAAGSQRNVVDQSIASARAAQPPAELTAALDAKYKPGDAAGRAMQFFMSKGYSQPQAAGIVGNLMQESGLDVGAINPGDGRDGSDSIGIAQWNGPRAQALRAYAAQNGLDLNDLDTQFGFIDHELRSTEQGAYNRLMQAQDPIQAAAAFVGYERPAGWTAENPYNSHGWGNRARQAAQLAGGTYDAGKPQQGSTGGTMPRADILKALVTNPLTREFGLQVATGRVDPAAAQKGVVINGKLVNPMTGRVMGDYSDEQAKIGLNQVWGTDENGNPVLGQMSDDGRFVPTQMPDGVRAMDPRTLAGERAFGTESGKRAAERIDQLPGMLAKSDNMLATIDGILDDPALDVSTGWLAWMQGVPGTDQHRFGQRALQLQGQAFLQAFESLKGGGQITEVEGTKAAQAIGRLSSAQSADDYRDALGELKGIITAAKGRAQQQAGFYVPPGAQQPTGGSQQTTTGVQWSFEP